MDFWDSTTVRLYVSMQQRERLDQGGAARRLATLRTRRAIRSRVAAALAALAARLDPALGVIERQADAAAAD